MHNGYCTFPIGWSYTWVNISKTGSQIFTKFSGFFGGSPVDLESVKISGSDSGILREGWEKSLAPLIYPLGGHRTPNFFPWVYRVSTFLPNFTPLRQKLGSWGRDKFLVFLNSNLQHEADSGHALGPIIVFISSYRGRNLLKKFLDSWISSPFWRYGLPNFTNFLVNFCQKFTSASREGNKG